MRAINFSLLPPEEKTVPRLLPGSLLAAVLLLATCSVGDAYTVDGKPWPEG